MRLNDIKPAAGATHVKRRVGRVPYLKIVGAGLLMWIGIQLLLPEDEGEGEGAATGNLAAAIRTIRPPVARRNPEGHVRLHGFPGARIWHGDEAGRLSRRFRQMAA